MMQEPKKTPLYENHIKLNARMVNFGGWNMPVQYTSIIEEHIATRTNVGLFDVSHMGEIEIKGADATPFLQKMVTQDVTKSKSGEQVQYALMCYPHGGVVDDILIYKYTPNHFLLCVNASNTEKDFSWLCENKSSKENVTLKNVSNDYVQIAIQGPKALSLLSLFTDINIAQMKYYRFTVGKVSNIEMIISRTGYTGENGFEIYTSAESGPKMWEALLDKGQKFNIKPCGLGARDTLRIEMRYPLYGHELSEHITPLEADLEWTVKFSKEDFIGKRALVSQKEKGLPKKCIGFMLSEPGIARQGHSLYSLQNELIGEVSSGTLSPTLNKAIGIGFVKPKEATMGKEFLVDIRGKKTLAKIVQTPFIERKVV